MGVPREYKLDREVEDFLVATLACFPGIQYSTIIKRVVVRFPEVTLTNPIIKAVYSRNKEKIDSIKDDTLLATDMAMKIGLLPLCDRLSRLQELHDLYAESKNGYEAEVLTNRGDIQQIIVKERRNEAAKILNAIASEFDAINPADNNIKVEISYGE